MVQLVLLAAAIAVAWGATRLSGTSPRAQLLSGVLELLAEILAS